MKKLFYAASFLLYSTVAQAEIVEVAFSQNDWYDLKENLVWLETVNRGGRNVPSIENLDKDNRTFLARMDCFAIDKYFTFQTDEDINELVSRVVNGSGWDVTFVHFNREIFDIQPLTK